MAPPPAPALHLLLPTPPLLPLARGHLLQLTLLPPPLPPTRAQRVRQSRAMGVFKCYRRFVSGRGSMPPDLVPAAVLHPGGPAHQTPPIAKPSLTRSPLLMP